MKFEKEYKKIIEAVYNHKINSTDLFYLINNYQIVRNIFALICQKDFIFFFKLFFCWHKNCYPTLLDCHYKVIDKLIKIENNPKNAKNLIINMAGGLGKSQLIQYFILWTFCKNKNHNWLYLHGNASTALELSKEMKNIILLDKNNPQACLWYKLFGTLLKRDSQAKNSWQFQKSTTRTGFFANGIFGNITGRDAGNPNINGESKDLKGGGGLILDDVLGANDMHSQTVKKRIEDTVEASAFSRIRDRKSCKIIILHHRLAVDDITGWVTSNQLLAQQFDIIKIPTLNESTNQSVWEDKYPVKFLNDVKKYNPYFFYSQLQQEPILREGSLIKKEWFQFYDNIKDFNIIPGVSNIFITADTAMSQKKSADYSVLSVWAIMKEGLFLLDMVREKLTYPELERTVLNLWMKWKGTPKDKNYISPYGINHHPNGLYLQEIHIENKASGIQLLQSDILFNANVNYVAINRFAGRLQRLTGYQPHRGGGSFEKMELANSITSWLARGLVYLPKTPDKIEMTENLLNECSLFTQNNSHAHDDILDTLIDAVRIGLEKNHEFFLNY